MNIEFFIESEDIYIEKKILKGFSIYIIIQGQNGIVGAYSQSLFAVKKFNKNKNKNYYKIKDFFSNNNYEDNNYEEDLFDIQYYFNFLQKINKTIFKFSIEAKGFTSSNKHKQIKYIIKYLESNPSILKEVNEKINKLSKYIKKE